MTTTVAVAVFVTMSEREPGHWVIECVDVLPPKGPPDVLGSIPEQLATTAVARWVAMRPTR